MNNKLKIILLIFIFLFIIGLSSFIYLNKDFIFKETEVKEQIDIEDKDEPILEIEDQEELDDEENTIIPEEDNVIPDKEDIVVENKEEDKNNKVDPPAKDNVTKPNKPNTSTNNNTNNNSSNDTNNNNNNNVDKEPVEEEPPVVTPPPTPTQEELNNTYRNNIQSTYGIKIAYGEEMGNYLVGNYTPIKMTNPDDINEYLGKIDNELKKYPTGFFKEIRDYGMNVTFYLVKDIPNSGIAGLTNSQFYANVVISIKEGLLFEKTLNHEIMHYIDAYLNSKMYPNTVETEWNMLNPTGFVYGVFDTNYDYFPTQNNNAYFFSNYSQTNYKEDRATLFEDIMTRAYKRPCYTNGYPLYSKIKLLAEQIDAGFNTVNSDKIEYWEKFIA